MLEGSIARRYARALLEIAREGGLTDRMGDDLARFARLVEGQLATVMGNPVFTQQERTGVLEAVLPGQALHPTVANFLRLLMEKGRFGVLPDIVREYRDLADQEAGRVRAVVTSATELSAATRDQVAQALTQATGKKVVIETRVDPTLLGGLVARVGSRVYDASLRTRLDRLQLALVHPSQA